MPLESASTIALLDSSWPLGGDPHNRGDDHIRLIKYVLQTQFPGAAGLGFAEPIIATEAEINHLAGVVSNVQTQLDDLTTSVEGLQASLSAPAGTKMVFYQAAAPTGWTQDTTKNDYMLRVVSTSGGGSGGSDSPILNNKVPSHTHSTDSQGNHQHTYSSPVIPGDWALGYFAGGISMTSGMSAQNTTTAGSHSHSVTTNPGAANWTPKYLDLIICTKD